MGEWVRIFVGGGGHEMKLSPVWRSKYNFVLRLFVRYFVCLFFVCVFCFFCLLFFLLLFFLLLFFLLLFFLGGWGEQNQMSVFFLPWHFGSKVA